MFTANFEQRWPDSLGYCRVQPNTGDPVLPAMIFKAGLGESRTIFLLIDFLIYFTINLIGCFIGGSNLLSDVGLLLG